MLLALRDDGRRTTASATGDRGQCPSCGEEVIARVGTTIASHWAHHTGGPPCPLRATGDLRGEWCDAWLLAALNAGWDVETVCDGHLIDIDLPNGVAVMLWPSMATIDLESALQIETTVGRRNPHGMVWILKLAADMSYTTTGWLDGGRRDTQLAALNARCYTAGFPENPVRSVSLTKRTYYREDNEMWGDDGAESRDWLMVREQNTWRDAPTFLAWLATWNPTHLIGGGHWRNGSWSNA